MAISSVGTPGTGYDNSSSTITGTWGSGQVRTAGDYLVAAVSYTAAGLNFSGTILSASGSWALLGSEVNSTTSGDGYACAAFFGLTAVGSDTAPTITASPGSGDLDCTMFELSGASGSIDTSGVYASGSSSGTVTFSVTTSANVAHSGEYAIALFTQYRALTGSLTWNGTGTGWTNILDGIGASATGQSAVDVQASPSTGATLSDSGNFSTDSSAYGAAMLIVFAASAGVTSAAPPSPMYSMMSMP